MEKNYKYSADESYPQIVAGYPDLRQVQCILNDYAGRESELTAVNQYIYQSIIFKDCYPEIAEALEKIAIVEMKHFDLLGGAIHDLGGDPIIGGTKTFWNGSFVSYIKNPKKALQNNIIAEQNAIQNYKKSIACSNNATVKALLERIILDEEVHIIVFKELLSSLSENEPNFK